MPEPRPGLPSGAIPYSSNTPFQSVFDTEGRHFLAPDQLAEVFNAKGVDIRKPTILTCGTDILTYSGPLKLSLFDTFFSFFSFRD